MTFKYKVKIFLLVSAVVLCSKCLKAEPGASLTEYPPKVKIDAQGDKEFFLEIPSGKRNIKAFIYCPEGQQAIVGVVKSDNTILWQKTTGSKASFNLFWSADFKYCLFYTNYWYSNVNLYAKGASKNNRDTNYIYVIEARTGKIVYELDPDIKVLHLNNIPDLRKWRPTLVGAGTVTNIQLSGNKLSVTEIVVPKDYVGAKWDTPIPDWLKRPFNGSIVVPNISMPAFTGH